MSALAWLFPGQGSQVVGMGKDVALASPAARAVFARADEALGEALSRTIFEGPDDALTLTENAQPAILTTSVALLEAVKERYPDVPAPLCAAGHSLGEYTALVASGAFTLEDAVRLVRARGRAMQDAVAPGAGAMAAILSLDAERVEAICAEASDGASLVRPANYNAPGQTVIAGEKEAVLRASALASAARGKAIPLKVSAPFHCPLMASATRVIEGDLARVTVRPLAFPVVTNVDAEPNADAGAVKDRLLRQVEGAVRWDASVRRMRALGVTHVVEVGPGKVLVGLVKRIDKEIASANVSDAGSLDALGDFLSNLTKQE